MRPLAILGFTLLGTAFGCHGQNSGTKGAATADQANEVIYAGDFIELTYEVARDPSGRGTSHGTYWAQSSTLTSRGLRAGKFELDQGLITFTDDADHASTKMTAPVPFSLEAFYGKKQEIQANSLISSNGMTKAVSAGHPLPYTTMTLLKEGRFEAALNSEFNDSSAFPTSGAYIQGFHWNGETHYKEGQLPTVNEDQPFDLDDAILLSDKSNYYIDLTIGSGNAGLEARLNYFMTDGAPGVAHAD